MYKSFILYLFLVFSLSTAASDTTYYSNGSIKYITGSKFKKEYDCQGRVKRFERIEKFFYKGKVTNFDTLGNILTKGKFIFGTNKHGKWKEYSNGKLIRTTKYKYGVKKRKTSNGRRLIYYWTYGFACRGNRCQEATDKFKVYYTCVAGCISTNKLRIKAPFHNFFVNIRPTIFHGFRWKKKMREFCKE